MFYVGEKSFQTRKPKPLKILPSIVGFIEKFPSESLASFKDISIFRKTDACKFDRVMLGPTCFASHSFKPNCRFVLKEVISRRCIQLELLCPIEENDEITVIYGNDFFGEGNQDCLCVHVDRHNTKLSVAERQPDSRPRLVLLCSRIRRFFGRSVAGNHPDKNWKCATLLRALVHQILIYHRKLPLLADFQRINHFVSSPDNSVENLAPSFSLSAINDHVSDSFSEDAPDSANERSCTFSQQSFAICVKEITARHGTSDAEASDWITLMLTAFPVPPQKSMKRKADETVKLALKTTPSCGEGVLITIDFKSDNLLVLKRNLNSIYEYNSSRSPLKYLNIPPFFDSSNKITVSMSMNSDGVRIIYSKKHSLWPLWLGILNLPPVLRCKFANIIFAKLWLGRGQPEWNVFFSQIKENEQSESSIE